jgi:hypothetical protein
VVSRSPKSVAHIATITQLDWTPARTLRPRRPSPSARILRIQQIVGELQEVSRLSHPGTPIEGLQLGQGPAPRPKVLCSPHLYPDPFAGDLHCSAGFDRHPKHPHGQPIRRVERVLPLRRSSTRLLATQLVTTGTHSKGTGFPARPPVGRGRWRSPARDASPSSHAGNGTKVALLAARHFETSYSTVSR